ncbi:MAG: hypothetical protein RL318_720 [Fibrobacterota bacterium]|jgi:hypothetical protein
MGLSSTAHEYLQGATRWAGLAILCANVAMAGAIKPDSGQKPKHETKGTMKFKTSRSLAASVLSDVCRWKAEATRDMRVTVLRNAQGDIGGYVSQVLILDSGIGYLDCDGKPLTSFHIFAPDEEKAAASKIIKELTRQFPVHEVLECPQEGGHGVH